MKGIMGTACRMSTRMAVGGPRGSSLWITLRPLMSSNVMQSVGQKKAQAVQPMQASEGSPNGGVTYLDLPRSTKLMASAPTISEQALTQRPHRMHFSSLASSAISNRVFSMPSSLAISFRGSAAGARAMSISTFSLRACWARSEAVWISIPS
jgi:hypothetical protein